MRAIGIKALKSRLSEYVRLAAGGETILVTNRNRVVAELGPIRETRSPFPTDTFLADAVRSGILTPTALVTADLPTTNPVGQLDSILDDLSDIRSDRESI